MPSAGNAFHVSITEPSFRPLFKCQAGRSLGTLSSRPNIERYLLHSGELETGHHPITIPSDTSRGGSALATEIRKDVSKTSFHGGTKGPPTQNSTLATSRGTPDQMDLLYSSHREPGSILDKDFQEGRPCSDPYSGSQALQPTAGCCLLERGMLPVIPQLRRLPGLGSRSPPPRLSAVHPETPLDKLTGTGAEKLVSLNVSQGG